MPTLRRCSLQTSLLTAIMQTTSYCLQVGQPSEKKPSEEQQAAERAVLVHKPGIAFDSELSHAGVAEALRAECQAAKLQAEQEQAALQATLQKLESTRQLRVAALQDGLPLGAAALQASRRQLQQQAGLQRRRHQDARLAELCAQHRLALAEGTIDRHQAHAGEQVPRFGCAARKIWQVLPEGIPSDPYIAHRVKVLTQGPVNRSGPAWRNGSLAESRFRPGPAAAVRLDPAGSVAPGCATSAGSLQAPLPATHRLPAQAIAISGQPSCVSRADVRHQPASAANSILQKEDGLRAEVNPQVRIAATPAIDHKECCKAPCRGDPSTVAATCSCAAKASQEHCPDMWQSGWTWGTALKLPAAQPPACHDSSLAICLGRATLRAGLKPAANFLEDGQQVEGCSHVRPATTCVLRRQWCPFTCGVCCCCTAGPGWHGRESAGATP